MTYPGGQPYPPPGYHWPPPAPPPPQPPPLDRKIAELRAEDQRPWGWRPVVVPLVALAVLIVASLVLSSTVHTHNGQHSIVYGVVANITVEGLLAVSVWFAGRDIAARYGGWARAFGWQRPRLADVPYAAAGFGIALAARFIVAIVANLLTNGRAAKESSNISINHVTPAAVILLVFIAVICAPLIEELMFRGLMLRTFMRSMGFWPAAILSSAIFALLHTYEVSTLVGAVTLAGVVGTLALTNCVLVRLTDRLTPGIAVHAISNGLGVLLLVLLN